MAEADRRVVAAAVVGGLADGPGDRWSDLDLTFAVDDAASVDDVLEEWTREVAAELGGVHLFDLPAGAAIYRVFLLPGCLQVDLSFAPASAFGARGPRFKLLFGSAVELPQSSPVVGGRAVRARRPPRRAGALLDRARPLVAGGALDQRRPRAGVSPRLPPAGPRRELRPASSTICRRRRWRRSRARSSARSSRRSSTVPSAARSRCCSASRRRPPSSPPRSRRSFRRWRRPRRRGRRRAAGERARGRAPRRAAPRSGSSSCGASRGAAPRAASRAAPAASGRW